MAFSQPLRRALLYVPASSPKFLAKSLNIRVDNVTYDLEDSVTEDLKPGARTALQKHLTTLPGQRTAFGEVAVRINALTTRHAVDDLKAVVALPAVDAIVIPKVQTAADLSLVDDIISSVAPDRTIKLLALIESAKAIVNLHSICAISPRLKGLIFAAEDYTLDLSLTRTIDMAEMLYARSAVVTAARAFEMESAIDVVFTKFREPDAEKSFLAECQNGKGLGFNGKQCIHPDQAGLAQQAFSPTEHEIEWATRIAIGDEKASAAGRGAWTLDGKMIDAPVSGRARAILARATQCGIDIGVMRERFKNQEPE